MSTNLKLLWQRIAAFLLHIENADNSTDEQRDVAEELMEEVTKQIQACDDDGDS